MFAAEEECPTNVSVLETCFSRYKYLRLLDLRYSSFEVLPSSIAYLKHLRYLSLQRNYKLRKLPNSICKLQSLQTLRPGGCEQLEELPRDIKKMVSLRFLILTTKQKILPENGIGCLKSLRFLSISKSASLETLLQEKQSLTNLRTLMLSNCEGLVSLLPFVKDLTSLETLAIIDCKKLELADKSDNQEYGLRLRTMIFRELPQIESLPTWLKGSAKSLQCLAIESCPNFPAFPEWLSSFASLQRFDITGCPTLLCLPESMLHLRALKKLVIQECPVLSDRCSFRTGVDWPLIESVLEFHLDGFTYTPFPLTRQ
ncbi:LRR domain containing protein [Parasponia andersonii]|uniref:LRR domain containing protein n=1 Tax=Parasponia andersonii TaxID=3476 RepID=A0A2P5AD25_PARAD|nr:LRR domain containing protein [Parasponia andersonii]